ncbi:prolycopene isomerase, chloroplastic isoform X3 [Argentina anserina]|uniref:prolycopene isomerase, chloroplastic isoform X1 n=1 Tax=Argentina anserina TaxID=57926 RepID=UPI0021766D25|nr:prolycopene isomerase, chloroplastic isoform X1 [Potentilla anserina]XP_050383436.1 prolycopene isomerase, chloroplastic isoform X1 [Potentilla anserina]XP_050383437.1 prolycopene isomerase, chloroplastic isoform X2 [Potentilla anserina]XP_050383438.1 prolycopene isomerase, chloroplastic isoform X3 [Potentilla anserina]XP_050383439.1 prolycopene isomerase, chloroplastic isoform X2 [Potentilla anserina]XP_050383440.1 prolycopene isomerase, chloroplastic isoform X2 [Potentilla anserina]XP_05
MHFPNSLSFTSAPTMHLSHLSPHVHSAHWSQTRPRTQKPPNSTSGCYSIKDRLKPRRRLNQGSGLRYLNGKDWSFVVRSSSALSVEKVEESDGKAGGRSEYDAIVIGSGIGGLVAATQLAVKGAKVLVLEKYVIPGGSSGYYERDGYTFDVGSSVMFGFSDKGNLNLITQALASVGCEMEVIPDPTTVHYHLPDNLSVRVHREYSEFISELTAKFPHEKQGILNFFGECWKVFNALNSLELKSLEEPIYLFGQFFQRPVECLTLAYYLPQNAGNIARRYIQDPQLLSFIDAECFIVSTVKALQTPMINASMVMCDRHYGGINYPVGGVGGIAKSLAKGLGEQGSEILYKANVTGIILDQGKAVGVRLSDKREFFAKTIISNATRWDTFGKLLKGEVLPKEEEDFQKVYVKAPSFLSIHMGVKSDVLPPDTDCHHFVLEDDWARLEEPYGSIFLSIPTILDQSLCPEGRHILHIFTTSSIEDWEGLSRKDYEAKKELVADEIISRLENKLFPGLTSSIVFKEVGTPKTHRRYLAREQGTYGPLPRRTPKGLLGMPFNTTAIDGLYCVGDSCFPGQGVIAVSFSGVMCAHRVAADLGLEKKSPVLDAALLGLLGWFRTLA